ncbi:MAG: hypothetical protein IH599_00855 [Bacteroidales bacterium]|nr:hypothetical protein [Bacteroidales bacterium]
MKRFYPQLAAVLLGAALYSMTPATASAQEKDAYDDGSVWNVTYVRTHANQSDVYLKDLSKTWATAMEAFKAEGLILSHKILVGDAFGDDDFNIMLMMEVKGFSQFDPDPAREAKFKAIEAKLQENMGKEKYDSTVGNYDNIRDILGSKSFRELHLKK